MWFNKEEEEGKGGGGEEEDEKKDEQEEEKAEEKEEEYMTMLLNMILFLLVSRTQLKTPILAGGLGGYILAILAILQPPTHLNRYQLLRFFAYVPFIHECH